ncbi:type II toxin-antitoxin system Phd/YefM family antitoxin [Synergistaceae bacterium OttesenSCG-928-I11]|nr:type II toxin-antitoxin system Phd/YefM family antitoxin [Synergistaceae bacterium OttesenSCG-928-I11]
MPQIRPVSDLRNKFAEISRIVHEEGEPVFLTKNGYGDMVVMSIEDYRGKKFLHDLDAALLVARNEAESTEKRRTHGEVMARMREIVKNAPSEI